MAKRSRYQELLAELANLQAEIEAERSTLVRDAVSSCKALIEEFGLTPFDLGFVKTQHARTMAVKKSEKTFGAREKRPTPTPKYVNPADGSTWSGMGRPPQWIVGNRDDYLIGELKEKQRGTQSNSHAPH
jgi:DNA-binding protein H-NS